MDSLPVSEPALFVGKVILTHEFHGYGLPRVDCCGEGKPESCGVRVLVLVLEYLIVFLPSK
jgi:hypothetical protein